MAQKALDAYFTGEQNEQIPTVAPTQLTEKMPEEPAILSTPNKTFVVQTPKKLVDKFIVPPFSILDSMQSYWLDRKHFWLSLGIKSEKGRDAPCNMLMTQEKWVAYGRKPMIGTSVFDPVVCEIMYRWFCVKKGKILDPFAGGSVRGIVASYLDYKYTGIELRAEQVEENIEQGKVITPNNQPSYITGDSNVVLDTINEKFDFVFTCPPYHDLETYCDDPSDLSNMDYDTFLTVYESIIKKSIEKLNDNSFYAIVVGDIRDKSGYYKNFPERTVDIFTRNGCKKYNEIIILKPFGTLPIRATRTFNGSKKVGKAHEQLYVFYKGDVNAIKDKFDFMIENKQAVLE